MFKKLPLMLSLSKHAVTCFSNLLDERASMPTQFSFR
jgi:hypothetical protein